MPVSPQTAGTGRVATPARPSDCFPRGVRFLAGDPARPTNDQGRSDAEHTARPRLAGVVFMPVKSGRRRDLNTNEPADLAWFAGSGDYATLLTVRTLRGALREVQHEKYPTPRRQNDGGALPMSRVLPWYKRDVDAWRGGTRSMTMELRGFYSECLDAMWDMQGPIPAEVEKLAMMFCCNPRTVRKLLPQLVAMGKLVLTPEGYENPRMMSDIRGTPSAPIRAEFEPNSSRIHAEFEPKVAKTSMFSTREVEEEKEEEEEAPSARARRGEILIEKGRVMIGDAMARDITAEFPHARIEEVAISAAAQLVDAGRLPPDAVAAIVRKCAMWNHRDNLRQAGVRAAAPGQKTALEIVRSMS